MNRFEYLNVLDDYARVDLEFRAMYDSGYGDLLRKRIENLDEGALYQSVIHGRGHIFKVMTLGSMIAYKSKMAMEDFYVYLYACAYHDVGRINDGMDTPHGARSAARLHELTHLKGHDLELAKAITTAHSMEDEKLEKVVRGFDLEDYDHAFMLTRRFKDADGLDRVRIHHLDSSYLRFPEAIDLVDFAYELNTYYKRRLSFKSLIIYKSYHHKNTKKIAKAMSSVIEAECVPLERANDYDLADYDLLGFGSGVYDLTYHKELRDYLARVKGIEGKSSFLFATYGMAKGEFHEPMKELLKARGAKVEGVFGCLAYGTFGPLKLTGGINRNKPTWEDMRRAQIFAQKIKAGLVGH